jgi:hypothetical protein
MEDKQQWLIPINATGSRATKSSFQMTKNLLCKIWNMQEAIFDKLNFGFGEQNNINNGKILAKHFKLQLPKDNDDKIKKFYQEVGADYRKNYIAVLGYASTLHHLKSNTNLDINDEVIERILYANYWGKPMPVARKYWPQEGADNNTISKNIRTDIRIVLEYAYNNLFNELDKVDKADYGRAYLQHAIWDLKVDGGDNNGE